MGWHDCGFLDNEIIIAEVEKEALPKLSFT